MQVTDIISQRYLCVAHHAVRALVGCYGWRHTHTQNILKKCYRLGKVCVHHTTMHEVTNQSHIHRVRACFAVTCHLHF